MGFAAGILGVGSYLPEKEVSNFDLEKIVDTTNEWIIERTGINTRRFAADDEATSDLCIKAAKMAIEDAAIDPEELDLVIVGTATADHAFPSTACIVQNAIGAKNAAAFDLSAGCSGFLYSMTVGAQMVTSGFSGKVLVIGAETLSRIMDFTDRNTCVLFGDGAGAAVLGRVDDGYGLLGAEIGSDGSGAELLVQPAGGSRLPASHETVDNHGHFIHMAGREVFKFAVRTMSRSCKRTLEKAGLTTDDVDLLVPHQANIRIIESADKRLKIPKEKIWVNIHKYGNTSAACIPICLTEASKAGRIKKGDNVLMVAFGTGLTWASAVVKWCKD